MFFSVVGQNGLCTALDDDSALNPPTMLAVLSHLRCAAPRLLVGSINWASVVPRATDTGVRADRCAESKFGEYGRVNQERREKGE